MVNPILDLRPSGILSEGDRVTGWQNSGSLGAVGDLVQPNPHLQPTLTDLRAQPAVQIAPKRRRKMNG